MHHCGFKPAPWWVFSVLCLGISVFTAHTSIAAPPVLHLANAGEPQTLDPHRYNLRLEETLLNDLFLGLTTFSAAGEIVPGAAASWHTSADGLTWTFNLRPDLRWSDGEALTAADFVFSYRRLQDPKTAASLAYFMYMLDNAPAVNSGALPPAALGVRASGPHTLILELSRPYPYLLERLLYPTAFPVPRHVLKEHGEDWVKPQHWVSNGAYQLTEWQPQAHVAMRANPHFHERVEIEQVKYFPVVNEQSAYNRYRNNELHAIGSFPVGELAHVRDKYPNALKMSGLLSMMYLVFNTERPPFKDVRVRQALSLAVDQQILTEKILRSGNEPAYSFAPQLIGSYQPAPLPHQNLPLQQRQKQARELLAEVGFSSAKPLEITLRHVTGIEGKKVNLAITGMWKQIGVNAQLHQTELRTHFADLRQGDFDVAWAGWVGENNPEHYLSLLQSDVGNVNYGRFKNDDYDALMAKAQTQASMQQRNNLLHEAETLVVHHYPVVPLYTVTVRRLVHPQLQGWLENPRDVHQVRYLSWQNPSDASR